jgi:hypothetical protein
MNLLVVLAGIIMLLVLILKKINPMLTCYSHQSRRNLPRGTG